MTNKKIYVIIKTERRVIEMPKSKKSYEERIADLEKKQAELKEAKKKLIAQHTKEERKKDTHNKIVLGATVLSVLGRTYIDGDEKRLIEFLKGQEERGGFFSSAMNRNLPKPTPQVVPDQNVPEIFSDNTDDDFFDE